MLLAWFFLLSILPSMPMNLYLHVRSAAAWSSPRYPNGFAGSFWVCGSSTIETPYDDACIQVMSPRATATAAKIFFPGGVPCF